MLTIQVRRAERAAANRQNLDVHGVEAIEDPEVLSLYPAYVRSSWVESGLVVPGPG